MKTAFKLIPLLAVLLLRAAPVWAQTLTVDATHAVNHLNPERDLGTTINRLTIPNTVARVMTPSMLAHMAGKGLKPVSYRLGTELHAEAWHWNPAGTWTDPVQQSGYFVGSATPGKASIDESWGYTLPLHAASLVDGSLQSVWKSNPYLDQHFTHEPNASLPQWVVVDLGRVAPIDAVRIAWSSPYATRYAVEYWTGGASNPHTAPTQGAWVTLPKAAVDHGHGGTVTLKLASSTKIRYLRILMSESSETCGPGGVVDRRGTPRDIRNCVGYAVREIYAGRLGPDGTLQDVIQHAPAGRGSHASHVWASSVDPWHRASDLHPQGGLQYGLDAFFKSGMTSNVPALIPIALLYSNPETAAHEVAYLEARHYAISRFELGEKPDSQWTSPEDYAALYIQFADAIHQLSPDARLGGPALGPHDGDFETWPDAQGKTSWMARFLSYLKAHHHLKDLSFVSFAYFPLPCNPDWSAIESTSSGIAHLLAAYRADGVPASVPLIASEANLSPGAGTAFETMFGALWQANYLAAFVEAGGRATYYFHGIPEPFYGHCGPGGGIFGSVNVDENFRFKDYLSQYFANRLVSTQWADPVNQPQPVYRVTSDIKDIAGNPVVVAYALQRPDGAWSVLALNLDPYHAHDVAIDFRARRGPAAFAGPVMVIRFGPAQYQWHPASTGVGGIASPDGPPVTSNVMATSATTFTLPAASLNVIRGNIQGTAVSSQ